MEDPFKDFEGALVSITYEDNGRVSAIKADVVKVYDNFIKVRTLKRELIIRKSDIRNLRGV